MSDEVRCDKCRRRGLRSMGAISPRGWLFAEVVDDTTKTEHYIYACSTECSRAMWKTGPGRLNKWAHWRNSKAVGEEPNT
jgi:hypothetical protein